MQAIYITVGKMHSLMVIPDSRAHRNGYPVLTFTYTIYRNKGSSDLGQMLKKEAASHLEKKDDPDYLREIIFEVPGKFFNYFTNGPERLSANEVEEANERELREYMDTDLVTKTFSESNTPA